MAEPTEVQKVPKKQEAEKQAPKIEEAPRSIGEYKEETIKTSQKLRAVQENMKKLARSNDAAKEALRPSYNESKNLIEKTGNMLKVMAEGGSPTINEMRELRDNATKTLESADSIMAGLSINPVVKVADEDAIGKATEGILANLEKAEKSGDEKTETERKQDEGRKIAENMIKGTP